MSKSEGGKEMSPSEHIDHLIASSTDWRGKSLGQRPQEHP